MRPPDPKPQWPFIAAIAAVAVWYPALTCLLGFWPSDPSPFGMVFNSMAEHLLAGRFDVDPGAIGAEAFDSGGRAVAYFGIFCALLRLPLVLTGHAAFDATWWSCLIAAWLAAWFQIGAVRLVWHTAARNPLAPLMLLSIVLGGAHIQFLRPSLWQEPISWAFAQAAGFVWLAARGLLTEKGFDRRTLSLMAVCAGLALITRVSFGIGLYAALGFLLLARFRPREWLAPGAALAAFAILAGIVNLGRWGNPLVFADFARYGLSLDAAPGRLGRLAAWGTFHPSRLLLGFGYYFLPVWIWIRTDGHVLFAEAQATLIDAMELPPGSFFLTDPLLLTLAVTGLAGIRDRSRAALLLGLSLPPILMLCAIGMAHRYRMEFLPFLFLAALFSLAKARELGRRARIAACAAVAIGVLASHATAIAAARSPWGPGEFFLERYGLAGTYARPWQ